jgi:glycerol-3-phosphate dehydrogenase (NAD(P)+)
VSRLAVIGAGSWGTALAIALAPRFEKVSFWARDPELALEIHQHRENRRYLPGCFLPRSVCATGSLPEALHGAHIVLTAVPSRHLRALYESLVTYAEAEACFVSATKGLENGTLLRMSELIEEILGTRFPPQVAVLSGPTFAKEIAMGEPAAVVIAARNAALGTQIQTAFAGPALRFYTSSDVIGVEIGAALKNVIAIAAGICHGLGLGGNTVAALVTRGLAELTRLAVALGGSARTLSGLAGLGDLVLTSTGALSRNRTVGLKLAAGMTLREALAEMTQIAEGVDTTLAAYELAKRTGVQMPIVESVYEILYRQKPVALAIRDLMERPLTSE